MHGQNLQGFCLMWLADASVHLGRLSNGGSGLVSSLLARLVRQCLAMLVRATCSRVIALRRGGLSTQMPGQSSVPCSSTLRHTVTVPASVFSAPLVPPQACGFSGFPSRLSMADIGQMPSTSILSSTVDKFVRPPPLCTSLGVNRMFPATLPLYASPFSTHSDSSLGTLPSEDEWTVQVATFGDASPSPRSLFALQTDWDMAPPLFDSDPTLKVTYLCSSEHDYDFRFGHKCEKYACQQC